MKINRMSVVNDYKRSTWIYIKVEKKTVRMRKKKIISDWNKEKSEQKIKGTETHLRKYTNAQNTHKQNE